MPVVAGLNDKNDDDDDDDDDDDGWRGKTVYSLSRLIIPNV